MLYTKPKKDALAIHERAVKKYNTAFHKMEVAGNRLYEKRCDCSTLIHEIELLVNSIANRPKEFDRKISAIQAAREKFHETESYAAEAVNAALKSGASVAAGIAGGAAVASMAPSAAMWVATTYGTASTGTAISALHGAVATRAALAWLGGGPLATGGAGIAGGQALLALAGPIGWGIAGVSTTMSAVALGHKNKQIADEAIAEAKKITIAGAEVNEATAKILHLTDETIMLMDELRNMAQSSKVLKGANYVELSEDAQYQLGTLVNNTLALAEMLNKTI